MATFDNFQTSDERIPIDVEPPIRTGEEAAAIDGPLPTVPVQAVGGAFDGFDLKDSFQPSQSEKIDVNGKVVQAPMGLNGRQIEYLNNTQNNGADAETHFAGVDIATPPSSQTTEKLVSFMKNNSSWGIKTRESIVRGVDAALRNMVSGIVSAYRSDAIKAQKDMENDWFMGNLNNLFGGDTEKFLERRKIDTEGYVKSADKIIASNQAKIKDLQQKSPNKTVFDISGLGVTIPAAIGLTAVTKNPIAAASLFATMQRGNITTEALSKGKTEEAARDIGMGAGAIEGGLELVGGGVFLKLAKSSKFVRRALGGFLNEGTQEAFQTGGEAAVTNFSDVRNNTLQEVGADMLYSFAIGGLVGGPTTAMMTGDYTGLRKSLETEYNVPPSESGAMAMSLIKSSDDFITSSSEILDDMHDPVMNPASLEAQAEQVIKGVTGGTLDPALYSDARYLGASHESAMKSAAIAKNDTGIEKPVTISEDAVQSPEKTAELIKDYQGIDAEEAAAILKNAKEGEAKAGLLKKTGDAFRDLNGLLNRGLVPISTRLERLNPKLKYAERKFEYNFAANQKADLEAVTPMVQGYAKMTPEDKALFKAGALNANGELIASIGKKYGLDEQMEQYRQKFDEIQARAKKEVKMDLGYIKDYFPRYIQKPKAFVEFIQAQDGYGSIKKELAKKQRELQRALTPDEQAQIIDRLMNESSLGELKKRKLKNIPPEMQQFYTPPDEAAVRYIHSLNKEIESRKLLGNSAPNIHDRVSHYTMKKVADGTITPAQEAELNKILVARFDQGRMGEWFSAYKNISYIDTMGGFTNALSQLGDLGYAAYETGVFGAAKNAGLSIAGKSKLTKKDLGLEQISHEFTDKSKTAEAVNTVFKLTGLNALDALGANTNINSALDNYRKLANKPNKEFLRTMDNMFGEESAKVIEELKTGQNTQNTDLLAFNRLLDMSPRAPSEMPEAYLRMGNGKILYMLKSFTIKQVDFYRNETFGVIRRDPVQGMKNLIRLTAFLALAGAGADTLKNIILGRDLPDIEDAVAWNILKIANINKFDTQRLNRGDGISDILVDKIAPPAKLIDNVGRDTVDVIKGKDIDLQDRRVIQDIPLVGSTFYSRFGKASEEGKERATERKKEERAEKALDERVKNIGNDDEEND